MANPPNWSDSESKTKNRLKILIDQQKIQSDPETDKYGLIPLWQIRKICEELKLKTSGPRKNLCETLSKYLESPIGISHAYKILNREILSLLFDDIDPISTYISSYQSEVLNPSILNLPTSLENMRKEKTDTRCVCITGTKPYIKCSTCNTNQHWGCMGRNINMQNYECVFCQMITWDPLQTPEEIFVMPYALPREDPKIIIRRVYKSFEVNENLMRKLEDNRKIYELQLRCTKFDGKGYNNEWPVAGGVILNGKTIFETHKLLEKNDLPLNLSKLVSFGTNVISVLKYNDSQYYAASVMLVKSLSFAEIYEKMQKSMTTLDENQGKAFIIKNFSPGNSKIWMKCSFTNKKIREPVRGTNCSHVQSFDLVLWLQSQGNPKVERWRCPVCKKRTTKLIKDLYMDQMWIMSDIIGNVEAIELSPDGSYFFHSSKPTQRKLKKKEEIQTITID